jgi:hypothetical protein
MRIKASVVAEIHTLGYGDFEVIYGQLEIRMEVVL